MKGNRKQRRAAQKNAAKAPKLGEVHPLHMELLPGDIRRLRCGNPDHPVHIYQWTGTQWDQLEDTNMMSAAIIGATLYMDVQTQASQRAQIALEETAAGLGQGEHNHERTEVPTERGTMEPDTTPADDHTVAAEAVEGDTEG